MFNESTVFAPHKFLLIARVPLNGTYTMIINHDSVVGLMIANNHLYGDNMRFSQLVGQHNQVMHCHVELE